MVLAIKICIIYGHVKMTIKQSRFYSTDLLYVCHIANSLSKSSLTIMTINKSSNYLHR